MKKYIVFVFFISFLFAQNDFVATDIKVQVEKQPAGNAIGLYTSFDFVKKTNQDFDTSKSIYIWYELRDQLQNVLGEVNSDDNFYYIKPHTSLSDQQVTKRFQLEPTGSLETNLILNLNVYYSIRKNGQKHLLFTKQSNISFENVDIVKMELTDIHFPKMDFGSILSIFSKKIGHGYPDVYFRVYDKKTNFELYESRQWSNTNYLKNYSTNFFIGKDENYYLEFYDYDDFSRDDIISYNEVKIKNNQLVQNFSLMNNRLSSGEVSFQRRKMPRITDYSYSPKDTVIDDVSGYVLKTKVKYNNFLFDDVVDLNLKVNGINVNNLTMNIYSNSVDDQTERLVEKDIFVPHIHLPEKVSISLAYEISDWGISLFTKKNAISVSPKFILNDVRLKLVSNSVEKIQSFPTRISIRYLEDASDFYDGKIKIIDLNITEIGSMVPPLYIHDSRNNIIYIDYAQFKNKPISSFTINYQVKTEDGKFTLGDSLFTVQVNKANLVNGEKLKVKYRKTKNTDVLVITSKYGELKRIPLKKKIKQIDLSEFEFFKYESDLSFYIYDENGVEKFYALFSSFDKNNKWRKAANSKTKMKISR